MPTVLALRLSEPRCAAVSSASARCGVSSVGGTRGRSHRSAQPFAVGAPFSAGQGIATWRLGWLPDRALPDRWPPQQLRLGESTCQVLNTRVDHQPFAAFAASRPVAWGLLRFLSPTYFSRNGRDLPLPDPVLVLRSLAQRWNAFAPPSLTLNDTLTKALLSAVLLTDAAVRTVRVQVGRETWQTGFLGDTALALTHTAATEVCTAFAALLRFATVAGIGARTTYGFGRGLRRTPRPTHPPSPYQP